MSANKSRREFYRSSILRRIEKIEDADEFAKWSKGQLRESHSKLKEDQSALDETIIQIISGEEATDTGLATENAELDEAIFEAKAKISDRLDELDNQSGNVSTVGNVATVGNGQGKVTIEVQATDAAGNVPNTWGTFDGDYAKWKSFYDRWKSSMHENPKVKTYVKFQNLKTSCIGAAAGAVGEWDLTDENYAKAWERLCSIYSDDYMQVQSFMKMLKSIPRMKKSTSGSIRHIIDTVQKHINGLKKYVDTDDKSIHAVFAVIDKMDTETYRAWEKHRRNLAKAKLQGDEANAADRVNIGKYIPDWAELESFLESEVTIRLHQEKRGEGDASENDEEPKQFKKRFKRNNKRPKNTYKNHDNRDNVPEFLRCTLCPGIHPRYKCEAFRAMNLTGRKDHVKENNLCIKCLRPNHSGLCEVDKNNEECPRCKPAVRFHNSSMCPNSELKIRTAMLAQEGRGRKRKYYGKSNKDDQAKKRRTNDSKRNDSSRSVASSVLKVGDWALVNNAIKTPNISDKERS